MRGFRGAGRAWMMAGVVCAGGCGGAGESASASYDASQPAPPLGSFGTVVPDSAFASALWTEARPGERAAAAPARPVDLRIEVDVAARTLHATRPGRPPWEVAVDTPGAPVERGQWTIRQVIWNPTPPAGSGRVAGRARLVADRRRTVEGSDERIVQVALLVMEAGGVAETDRRSRRGVDDPTATVVVDLPRPVTIRVY